MSILKVLLFSLLLISLTACDDSSISAYNNSTTNTNTDQNTTTTTGGKTQIPISETSQDEEPIEVKNTISGSPELFKKTKEKIIELSNNISSKKGFDLKNIIDTDLTESIKNAEIKVDYPKDNTAIKNLNISITVIPQNKIKIYKTKKNKTFFSQTVDISTPLEDKTFTLPLRTKIPSSDVTFNLRVVCHSASCQKATAVVIYCEKFDAQKICKLDDPQANIRIASFLYTNTRAYLRVAESNTDDVPELDELQSHIKESHQVYKKSFVMVEGASFSEINVTKIDEFTDKDGISKKKENTLHIRTDNVDTSTIAVPAKIDSMKSATLNTNNLKTALVGNNPTKGSLVLDVQPENSSKTIRIYADETPYVAPKEFVPQTPLEEIYKNSYINPLIDQSDKNIAIIKHLESYRNTEMAQTFIAYWSGKKDLNMCNIKFDKNGRRNLLRKFYFNAQPFKETIYKAARHIDTTPDFAYLTILESKYLTFSPNQTKRYVIETTGSTTATGPFQFVDGTAREQANKIKNIKFNLIKKYKHLSKKGKLNSRDDRKYFETAALLGANYSKELVARYPEDSALGPMAYKLGMGHVDQLTGHGKWKRPKFKESLIDLYEKKLYKYKKKYKGELVTASSCQDLKYALDILAIKLISADPEKYGFDIEENPTAPSDIPNLFRPSGSVLNHIKL